MSSRAHARRRLAAWDRYFRSYTPRWNERPADSLALGHADLAWWVRAGRHRPVRRRR